MTDAELADIEARAKAATEGPWVFDVAEDYDPDRIHGLWSKRKYGDDEIIRTDSGVYPPCLADAEFIAHAREDVPALIAEVRRLRAALEPKAPTDHQGPR